jgi:hypothetical protein
MAGPMSRDEVLDELEFLATVEHALVVEYLTVRCALGHDLGPGEGGATTTEGGEAAAALESIARDQMTRFKHVNFGLVDAGRSARMDRAFSISSDSHPAISLDPPSAAQLERLLDREEAIALAADERYARLAPAVASDTAFEGAEQLRPIVEEGQTHSGALVSLHALGNPLADGVLRATRREPADEFERRLLGVSDRTYRVVVGVLQGRFVPEGGTSLSLALSAMDALDDANRVLVQRGMLPPFSPV